MGTRADLSAEELDLLRAAGRSDLREREVTISDREAPAPAPRRRRSDFKRVALSSTEAEKQAAGSLKTEVVYPFGLGVLVVIFSTAVIGLIADRSGSNVVTAVIASAVGLTAGLVWWAGTILTGATVPALKQLKRGLQQIEEGNYDIRLERVRAAEFS